METVRTTEIEYRKGDATAPVSDGMKIIVHVCNNIGAWGAGFVLALSKRWLQPEAAYRAQKSYNLGDYELVEVTKEIKVCNLIGQENTRRKKTTLPPVRYVAIEHALRKLAKEIRHKDVTVHMPMIGSGLAGGNWWIVERIIETTLCAAGVPVIVYQFD